jgi:hypothetical protein
MADAFEPDESVDELPQPVKPAGPKRGAFPTPQPEIDSAPPYVPDLGEDGECPAGDPAQPTDAEDQGES